MKEELIEMGGVVVDKQPNAYFKVQINDTDHMVLATISGRMRRNRIRILMGDRVDIELSPYDLTKGRIPTGTNRDGHESPNYGFLIGAGVGFGNTISFALTVGIGFGASAPIGTSHSSCEISSL